MTDWTKSTVTNTYSWQQLAPVVGSDGEIDFALRVNDTYPLRVTNTHPNYIVNSAVSAELP